MTRRRGVDAATMESCLTAHLPNATSLVPTPWHSESLPAYLYSATLLQPQEVNSSSKFSEKPWYFGFYPTRLQKLFSQRRTDISSRIRRAEKAGWDLPAVFARLRRDGLVVRLAGLDFTRLQHTRCAARCRALQLTCTADDCARVGPALLATDLDVRLAMWLLSDVSSKGAGTAGGMPSAALPGAPSPGESAAPRALPPDYAGASQATLNSSHEPSYVSTEQQYLFGGRQPGLTRREVQLQEALLRGARASLLDGIGEAWWYFSRYGFYFPGGVSRLLWLCDQRARHDGCSIAATGGAIATEGAKGFSVGGAQHGVHRAALHTSRMNASRGRKHTTGGHGGRRAIEVGSAMEPQEAARGEGFEGGTEGGAERSLSRLTEGRRLEGKRLEVKRLLRGLHLEGHVAVRDYAAWGLDLPQLQRETAQALHVAASSLRADAATVSSTAPLPSLRPLLEDESLAILLRRYLGGEVNARAWLSRSWPAACWLG